MLVACFLLNQTTNQQVRKVLPDLLRRFGTPEKMSEANPDDIASIIRSTGFYNIKTKKLIEMSRVWINGFKDPIELPGVGEYARDSWRIFVEGDLGFTPRDRKLLGYINRKKLCKIKLNGA
jgi:endonuclease III